jgi:hypothetical protein
MTAEEIAGWGTICFCPYCCSACAATALTRVSDAKAKVIEEVFTDFFDIYRLSETRFRTT